MRVSVIAVGRMKRGPETELLARYGDRLAKSGRALGLHYGGVTELGEARGATAPLRMEAEAAAIVQRASVGATIVALDERGATPTSEAFAADLARRRDAGTGDLVFVIGGPDGHGDALRARADALIAFGAMTWPHQIVRVLLLEQLYRATTILSGHPYHRS